MAAKQVEINTLTINETTNEEDVVTPWDVSSKNEAGIDYDKLISEFHYFVKKDPSELEILLSY